MPCYHPLTGYVGREYNESGKASIVFNHRDGWVDRKVKLPCGKCVGCLQERARQWAVRCMNEASLYDDNSFVTLTIDPEHIPASRSLVKSDFVNFMKRLRKFFSPNKIRFFHCGEYGDKLSRPHHHALLFNCDFPDKELITVRNGNNVYGSLILKDLWPFGFSSIGDVTLASAKYVASYVGKKVFGNDEVQASHYRGRVPEYVSMSLKPGIGFDWLQKFSSDIYPRDELILKGGYKCKPPKYYDRKYELTNPDEMAIILGSRERSGRNSPDNVPSRLEVREEIKLSKVKQLRRDYENESI